MPAVSSATLARMEGPRKPHLDPVEKIGQSLDTLIQRGEYGVKKRSAVPSARRQQQHGDHPPPMKWQRADDHIADDGPLRWQDDGTQDDGTQDDGRQDDARQDDGPKRRSGRRQGAMSALRHAQNNLAKAQARVDAMYSFRPDEG